MTRAARVAGAHAPATAGGASAARLGAMGISRVQALSRGTPRGAAYGRVVLASSASTEADRDAAKAALRVALEDTERGIFGLQKTQRAGIHALVEALEAANPCPQPLHDHMDAVAGEWRLLYTTVQILGSKRTKLGLRNFVRLGDFVQRIDLENSLAINEVAFVVPPLYDGALTITASFEVESATRVAITYEKSTLVPDQLQSLFEKNYDVLLAVFNPDGWLDITYVDADTRVGRDDKGNIFVTERI